MVPTQIIHFFWLFVHIKPVTTNYWAQLQTAGPSQLHNWSWIIFYLSNSKKLKLFNYFCQPFQVLFVIKNFFFKFSFISFFMNEIFCTCLWKHQNNFRFMWSNSNNYFVKEKEVTQVKSSVHVTKGGHILFGSCKWFEYIENLTIDCMSFITEHIANKFHMVWWAECLAKCSPQPY